MRGITKLGANYENKKYTPHRSVGDRIIKQEFLINYDKMHNSNVSWDVDEAIALE